MDLLVLNTNLEVVGVVDTFESIIWTDRYFKYGDFELYTSVNRDILSLMREDYFVWSRKSDHVMIVEGLKINTDTENGNYMTVTGRSLESILDRRIIWGQVTVNGNLQDAILLLLTQNIINPEDEARKIPNFIFEASTDPVVTALTISAQYSGDNLYTVIQTLCEVNNIGFRITLTDDGEFKFALYSGTDRSYDQLTSPYVVFSPKFNNIINSNYIESKKTLKTITLVAGEGDGAARKLATVSLSDGGGSGLTRREIFTDAKGVSSTVNGGTLTDEEYRTLLAQKGLETLSSNIFVTSFEGEVDTTHIYKYGEDFFMGDIIQIANEYDMEAKARVVELILSQSLTGIEIYPTFATV